MPQEESKEVLSELFKEEVSIVDMEPELKIPKEVKSHLEKIEKELHTIQPIKSSSGRVMAQPPVKKQVKITVPMTRNQYVANLRQPVENSIRWLTVFFGRLMKMFPGRISFRGAKAD